MAHDTLIILGSGYTARFVWPLALRHYAHVFATSREPNKNLHHVAPEQRIQFDLMQQNTWVHIPHKADILWCFPATPLDLIQQLAGTLNPVTRRLVVLGSTSAYDVGDSRDYPPPWIDETAPLNLSKSRVQGEEFLRTRCNAIVLRVAGIYGPDRNPIDWIRTDRVALSRKFVNLIHVEDLAAICLAALERGAPGEAYNVSDGTPRTWRDIGDMAQARFGLTAPPAREETGKRICNRKLTRDLGYKIQHPDLYKELDRLR